MTFFGLPLSSFENINAQLGQTCFNSKCFTLFYSVPRMHFTTLLCAAVLAVPVPMPQVATPSKETATGLAVAGASLGVLGIGLFAGSRIPSVRDPFIRAVSGAGNKVKGLMGFESKTARAQREVDATNREIELVIRT